MVKAALITPAYLSIAWALMVSYQIFTTTAVTTVIDQLTLFSPAFGGILLARVETITFVYAFAWVFVLSSIIPGLILGRERSVLVQFAVCLTLTLLGLELVRVINESWGFDLTNAEVIMANPYMQIFSNIFFAAFYLALPYIFMLSVDYRCRSSKKRKENERLQKLTDNYGEGKTV